MIAPDSARLHAPWRADQVRACHGSDMVTPTAQLPSPYTSPVPSRAGFPSPLSERKRSSPALVKTT